MKSFEYPDVKILPKEIQYDDEGNKKGVSNYTSEDNVMMISIDEDYQKLSWAIADEKGWEREEVYFKWIVNAIVHEDIHWLLENLGFVGGDGGEGDKVHNAVDDLDIGRVY